MNKETAINPMEKKKRALPGEMMILIILIAMFIVLSIPFPLERSVIRA